MFKQPEAILKIACCALGVLWAGQLITVMLISNPARGIVVPAQLSTILETPAAGNAETDAGSGKPGGPKAEGGGQPKSGPQPPGRPGRPGGPGGGGSALPPEVQAYVDTIKKSELLGPVPAPRPIAIFGLAGDRVMMQTPSGPTDWVASGDELGGVKVLKIAANRVLIEHEGKKQELTIFNGIGSESLMSTESNEAK